jgi:2-polyprenyl-3-methyl-5-hydroxy-6-metoxy-1,4-benzoquinol methylase
MDKKIIDVNNPFEIERYRHLLASEKKLKKLRETYSSLYKEIPNMNTGLMWDSINPNSDYSYKSNPMAHDRIRAALNYVKIKNREIVRVLDIGFGPGDFENLMSAKYNNTVKLSGIDISNRSVIDAKKSFPQWKFINSDIKKYKEHGGRYDYVIALEVLEHISPSEIMNILNKIYNLLGVKGKFILSVPINENLEEMVNNGINPNAHVRTYTKELIETELELSKFKILRSKQLVAFHKFYKIKSIFVKMKMLRREPNNIVILCEKL